MNVLKKVKEAGRRANRHIRTIPVSYTHLPVNAPYFNGANLLIAADCTAYAYGRFHEDFIRDRIVLIGCPKLDACDYTDKLTLISFPVIIWVSLSV